MGQKKFNTEALAKFFETKWSLAIFAGIGLLLGVIGVYYKRNDGFAEMMGAFDSGLSIALSILAFCSVLILVSAKKERASRAKASLMQTEQDAKIKGAIVIIVKNLNDAISIKSQAMNQFSGAKFNIQHDLIEVIIIDKDRMQSSDMYEIKEKAKISYGKLIEQGVDLIYLCGVMPMPVAFMLGDEFGNYIPFIVCHFENSKYEPWYESVSGMIASPDYSIAKNYHPIGELQND
jgi:hypothetical protein